MVIRGQTGLVLGRVGGGIRKEDVVTFFEDTPQRMKTRVVGGD